jgi:iron(III) transport system substrate-binding protein
MTRTIAALLGTAIAASTLTAAQAQELNLYSSRHYDTDERLYSDFTEATGITINRIEGNADELIARMQAEGANSARRRVPDRRYRAAGAGGGAWASCSP